MHFVLVLFIMVVLSAMMGSLLFCEIEKDFSTVEGMIFWSMRFAILLKSGDLLSSSYTSSGMDISIVEVRMRFSICRPDSQPVVAASSSGIAL